MTTSRTTAVLFFGFVVSLAFPARPQQTKPAASKTQTTAPSQQSKSTAIHANPDQRQILVTSGILSLLSSSEADLVVRRDAHGHPVTLTFLCDKNTKEDKASKGDAVNILYVANGHSNLALVIHLIQSSGDTKGSPDEVGGVAKAEPTSATGSSGEIGGVASASPPPPAYSLSPSDAQSLQKKLEGDFGLTVADGDTKPAYGRIVTLKNHDLAASLSSDTTPWNIYVNGGIQTDLYGTTTTTTTTSSSSLKSAFPTWTHKPPSEETPKYVFTPGDTLEVVDVEVDGNSVLLKLAAERPAHGLSSGGFGAVASTTQRRVYSTLAFPITSDDTPPASTVEQQIAQLLDPKSPSVYNAGQSTTVGTQTPSATSAAGAAAAPAASAAAPSAPATIALGQTQKQVIEALGNPERIVKMNKREIYVYKDRRVTFVKGKVTDVQ
jgi:hypothetical protein